jgi:molecular chaperone GrpE
VTSADDAATAGAHSPGGGRAADQSEAQNQNAEEPITINDKRVIDPETGAIRPEAAAAAGAAEDIAAATEPNESASDDARVAELTNDLKRVSAEYANYRKRVDRDRALMTEITTAKVLNDFLPVLDDLSLAEKNGDLTGTFNTVATALRTTVARLGLEQYGAVGEAFDPEVHEALAHRERTEADGDGDGQICVEVYQPGYRFKDRVVRPARVVVAE